MEGMSADPLVGEFLPAVEKAVPRGPLLPLAGPIGWAEALETPPVEELCETPGYP